MYNRSHVIQKLTYGKTAAHLPTWENTHYLTLKQAREADPSVPASFFRRKDRLVVEQKEHLSSIIDSPNYYQKGE